MFDDGHVGYVVEFQDGADVDGVGVAAKHIDGGDNEAFSGRDGFKNGVGLGKRVLGGEALEVLVESKADFAWPVVRIGCWRVADGILSLFLRGQRQADLQPPRDVPAVGIGPLNANRVGGLKRPCRRLARITLPDAQMNVLVGAGLSDGEQSCVVGRSAARVDGYCERRRTGSAAKMTADEDQAVLPVQRERLIDVGGPGGRLRDDGQHLPRPYLKEFGLLNGQSGVNASENTRSVSCHP